MRRTDDVSLWPWSLTLEVMVLASDAGQWCDFHLHTNFEVLTPYLRYGTFCVSALVGLWPWPFISWPWNWYAIFVIQRQIVLDLWAIGPTRLRLFTWPCRSRRLWLMRVIVLHLYTKFEVRRYGARYVSALMGLVTLTFDLETGMRIASNVGSGEPSFQISAR